jgi:hypothetical protein
MSVQVQTELVEPNAGVPDVAQLDHDRRPSVSVLEVPIGPVEVLQTRPAPSNDDDGLVRAFVVGALVGCVATFTFFVAMSLILRLGLGPAIGIGVFTAFWGGPGFGGMMGAVLRYSRNEPT